MRQATIKVLAFLTLVCCVSAAQDKQLDLSHARELAVLMMPRDNYDAMLKMIPASFAAAGAQGKDAEKMQKVLEDVMPYDEVIQHAAEAYALHFSFDEIQELINFYSSPIGRKSVSTLPQISGRRNTVDAHDSAPAR